MAARPPATHGAALGDLDRGSGAAARPYTGFRYRIASYSEQLAPLVASLPPTGTIATPDGRTSGAAGPACAAPSAGPQASLPRSSARGWSQSRRARSAR